MPVHININHNVSLNLEELIQSKLLVQANSGGGKSWLLRRILEQSHGKIQQIVLDSEGEFGTLREHYGYILAGSEGDTPADPRNAAFLARWLLEERVSCIIDLYELHPQERKRFVKLFLESMVNAPKSLWHPVMVFLDEAHIYAPEKGQSEALDAVIGLASLGRKREFCAVLATQRISKLHKDVAAECNNKLVGRTGLDIDMKRASDDLGFTSKEQYYSLRTLAPGEFFAYGPALFNEVKKITVGEVKTTHKRSGKSATHVAPPSDKMKEALKKLSTLPAEAKKEAQTVAELKAEIGGYKRELSTLKRQKPEVDPNAIQQAVERALVKQAREVAVLKKKEAERFKRQINSFGSLVLKVKQAASALPDTLPFMQNEIEEGFPVLPEKYATELVHKVSQEYLDKSIGKMTIDALLSPPPLTSMGQGEKKILIAASQYPEGANKDQLTVLTGFKRSTRDAYIARLRAKGFITDDGVVKATEAGVEALGSDYTPLPTGAELIEYWKRELPEGERKIFEVLLEASGRENERSISRDEISSIIPEFKRSTRDAYLARMESKKLVVFEGRGLVRLSENLTN